MVMRVAVALLALSLSACTSQSPRSAVQPSVPPPVSRASVSAATSVPITSASGRRTVFVKFESGCGDLTAVERTIARDKEPLAETLNQLFAGPTDAERARGVSSMFSVRTTGLLRSVRAADGTAQVDLAPSVANRLVLGVVSPCDRSSFHEQVATTLQQFPGVRIVRYAIGGDRKAFLAAASRTTTRLQPGAAGVCAQASPGAVAVYAYGVDGVPQPRCGYAQLNQRLRISNPTAAPILVALSTGQQLHVPSGASRTFPGTLSDLVRTPPVVTTSASPMEPGQSCSSSGRPDEVGRVQRAGNASRIDPGYAGDRSRPCRSTDGASATLATGRQLGSAILPVPVLTACGGGG